MNYRLLISTYISILVIFISASTSSGGPIVVKSFKRKPFIDKLGPRKIIVGKLTDDMSGMESEYSEAIRSVLKKQISQEGIHLLESDDSKSKSISIYRLPVYLRKDSIIEEEIPFYNSIFILGTIEVEGGQKLETRSKSIISKNSNCNSVRYYSLQAEITVNLYFIETDNNKIIYRDSFVFSTSKNGESLDACENSLPPEINVQKYLTDYLSDGNIQFSRSVCHHSVSRNFYLRDDLLTDPFPDLASIADDLMFKNYPSAIKKLRFHCDEDWGNRVKSKAYFNYSIGFLCSENFDSSLFYMDKAIALKKNPDFEKVLACIKEEMEISKSFLIPTEQTNALARSLAEKQEKPKSFSPDSSGKKPTNIYAVIIGVADFKDTSITDLKYTERDCKSYYELLTSPQGGGINPKQIELLLGSNVTRSNVVKALNRTFGKAFESDVVILFIASHGEVDAAGKEVYFLMHDTEASNLEGSAISQFEIQKIIGNSYAKHKIIVADACHSGGLGFGLAMRNTGKSQMVNRLLKQLDWQEKSLAVFTASSGFETSRETPDLGGGHGVFTHFFIQGLKGAADSSKNGIVTIRELYEYVYRGVGEYTEGKQHPELKGNFDNALPMSVYSN